MKRALTLTPTGGEAVAVELEVGPDGAFSLIAQDETLRGYVERLPSGEGLLRLGARTLPFYTARVGRELHLWLGGEVYRFSLEEAGGRAGLPESAAAAGGEVRAPMPGRVVQLPAEAGMAVTAGDLLAVIESMKVQFNVTAPIAGRVSEVRCEVGSMVELDAVLARVESDE